MLCASGTFSRGAKHREAILTYATAKPALSLSRTDDLSIAFDRLLAGLRRMSASWRIRAYRRSGDAVDGVKPFDHPTNLGSRTRTAEIESLYSRAAGQLDEPELLDRLDAFGCGLHAEILAQRCDGAHDGCAFQAFAERADEGAVDLDRVEGKFPQIAERGIADAEIVEADTHAERAQ